MYSMKSVGQKMDSLTRYFCEDFPSRNARSCLILRKDKIRPHYRPEIFYQETEHAKPCWKPWIYQVLQFE